MNKNSRNWKKQVRDYLNELEARERTTNSDLGDVQDEIEDIKDDITDIENELDQIPYESGFVNRADSVITFTDGTRTFEIAPAVTSYEYWQGNTKYEKTVSDSVVITDVEGLHFMYFNGTTLISTTTFTSDIITSYALVAVVYWDADNDTAILFGEERHGHVMDSATHVYNHNTFGARFGGGLALGNMDVDGSGNDATAAQFSVQNGTIWDEDIEHSIVDDTPQDINPTAQIPIYYRSGAAGLWRKLAATSFPISTTGTGRAAWNEDTGATWQITEVANGDFCLMHYYATNDMNDPIIGVMGQGDYATLGAAREGATTEINSLAFGALSDLTPEFVPLATVIFETRTVYSNAVKSRIRSTDDGGDYIDWRVAFVGSGGAAGGLTDPDAIHQSIASEISGLTEKTTPVDADVAVIEDSEDSFLKKKVQLGNLPGGGGGGVPSGGTEGQFIIKQSSTEGDAEWDDADIVFSPTYPYNSFETGDTLQYSGSAYASKGTVFKSYVERDLLKVTMAVNGDASATYKLVICRVDDFANSYEILEVIEESSSYGPVTVAGEIEHTLVDRLTMLTDEFYAVICVRTDGTATTACATSFYGTAPVADTHNLLAWDGAIRYASNDPTVGDNTSFDQASHVSFKLLTESTYLKDNYSGGMSVVFVDADHTAEPNSIVCVDTTTSAVDVTLPASPSEGDQVKIIDSKFNASVNAIGIPRNGKTIDGLSVNGTIILDGGMVEFYYDGTGWLSWYVEGAAVSTIINDPTDIANCVLWLDASDRGTTTNQWDDKSGNSNHFLAASAAEFPTFASGVATFDGSNDHLDGFDASALTEGEIFIVMKRYADNGDTGTNTGWMRFGTAGLNAHFTYSGGVYPTFGQGNQLSTPGNLPEDISQYHVINMLSAFNDWRFWLDGNVKSNIASNTVSFPTQCILGKSVGGYYFQGDIKAVAMFSRKLTDTERSQMTTYMTTVMNG